MRPLLPLLFVLFLAPGFLSAQKFPLAGLQKGVDTLSSQLFVFPNPVIQSLRLLIPEREHGTCHLYVVDVHGRVVRSFADLKPPETAISLVGLQQGIYLLELRGRNSYYRRIVVP